MIKLLGFAPDADPTTPGLITDCTNLIPSERGMAGAPEPVSVVGVGPLAAAARGAAVITKTSGTRRVLAGTQTKLYELSSTTWIDYSAATYAGSSESRWMFAQFGDAALATNDADRIQAGTAGTFATVATAPAARIIVSTRDFVLAFNTNEATFGDSPDRWWCSEFQNHAVWTPSATTQATTGRLIGNGGELTAATRFGEYVAAFKETSMFLGRYVGPPIVWQWDQIPGDVGCIGPEAVADVSSGGGASCVFVGNDNIWAFAGDRPVPIATGQVAQWFLNNSSATYRYRSILKFDQQNRRLWLFFPSPSSSDGTPDSSLVYHLDTKQWGRANRTIEAVFNYVTPGLTWDTFNTVASTWDALPNVPWDSQTFQASGRAFAIFNSSHQIQTMTGGSTTSGLTTGDFGDDDMVTTVQGVRLRFNARPTSATGTGYVKDEEGDALTTRNTISLSSDGKFDLLQAARFHRFSFTFTGAHEVSGIRVKSTESGYR